MDFFNLLAPIYEWFRPGARVTARRIMQIAEFLPTDVVVDVGGGTGVIAQHFVGRVRQVHVIDPSPRMIARCSRHAGLTCTIGIGEHLPFADQSIDKVILVDAFHHIQGQRQAIREMRRVLKPGGSAILVEFNPATLGGKAIELIEKTLRMGSVFHTPSRLRNLFIAEGFSVSFTDEQKMTYYLVAASACSSQAVAQ